MLQKTKSFSLAALLLGLAIVPINAAEREDVRKVINLLTSVKMPFPESITRNRAKTERVRPWLRCARHHFRAGSDRAVRCSC